MDPILQIKDLNTSFYTSNGELKAVRGVSFEVMPGEVLGIVGESGSGKSVTAMSILRLLADTAKIKSGEIIFRGKNIAMISKKEIRSIRGKDIAMVFQDPMSSLNPLVTVGKQVGEMIRTHFPEKNNEQVKAEVLELFHQTRIPEPEKRYSSYPHEFSGGMRQRVMISIALACHPDILIADEPTTALDVTIQAQILKMLSQLRKDLGMSIIFITHDLGVVAEICDRVCVMYGGMVMETSPVDNLFEYPMHPYTHGLMRSMPSIDQDKESPLIPIPGSPPDMLNPPAGCPFCLRCQYARNICATKMPPFYLVEQKHYSRCWLLSTSAPDEDNPFSRTERERIREVQQ